MKGEGTGDVHSHHNNHNIIMLIICVITLTMNTFKDQTCNGLDSMNVIRRFRCMLHNIVQRPPRIVYNADLLSGHVIRA